MTIISFFRDILPKALNHRRSISPTPRYPRLESHLDNDLVAPIRQLFQPMISQQDFGIFRFSWLIQNSEVHLPINSCGNDAIVFIFQTLSLYRHSLCHEINFPKSGKQTVYCQGPSCGEDIWISFFEKSHELLSQTSDCRSWNWDHHFHYTESPFSRGLDSDGCSEFQIAMNLKNAIICSWCSDNAIIKSLNLSCLLTIQPISLAYPSMYSSVFSTLGFHPSLPMNCFIVELVSQEIDWVLSEGQYLAVVYMIQQNFPSFAYSSPLSSPPD